MEMIEYAYLFCYYIFIGFPIHNVFYPPKTGIIVKKWSGVLRGLKNPVIAMVNRHPKGLLFWRSYKRVTIKKVVMSTNSNHC